jgi:hypothetical protein
MQSDHPVTCISADSAAGIHAYFDLCPESPDERRVVYFQFFGTVPGPGQLVVTDRAGRERHPVGAPCQGRIEMGVALARPPDIARLARVAPNYGIELLGGA